MEISIMGTLQIFQIEYIKIDFPLDRKK